MAEMGTGARPTKMPITRDLVVQSALLIIDAEGLDSFSMPRLARELDIRAPSLYYHFVDKSEILRAISSIIILDTEIPDRFVTPNWIEWFVQLSLNVRSSVLRHRNAAPLLLRFLPRDILARSYDASARILMEVGVPADRCVLLLDGMDKLTLGAAITEAARSPDAEVGIFPNAGPSKNPALAHVLASSVLSADELFAEALRSFLRGAVPMVDPDAPPPDVLNARRLADLVH